MPVQRDRQVVCDRIQEAEIRLFQPTRPFDLQYAEYRTSFNDERKRNERPLLLREFDDGDPGYRRKRERRFRIALDRSAGPDKIVIEDLRVRSSDAPPSTVVVGLPHHSRWTISRLQHEDSTAQGQFSGNDRHELGNRSLHALKAHEQLGGVKEVLRTSLRSLQLGDTRFVAGHVFAGLLAHPIVSPSPECFRVAFRERSVQLGGEDLRREIADDREKLHEDETHRR